MDSSDEEDDTFIKDIVIFNYINIIIIVFILKSYRYNKNCLKINMERNIIQIIKIKNKILM